MISAIGYLHLKSKLYDFDNIEIILHLFNISWIYSSGYVFRGTLASKFGCQLFATDPPMFVFAIVRAAKFCFKHFCKLNQSYFLNLIVGSRTETTVYLVYVIKFIIISPIQRTVKHKIFDINKYEFCLKFPESTEWHLWKTLAGMH